MQPGDTTADQGSGDTVTAAAAAGDSDELTRLRAERDEARAALERERRGSQRQHGVRRVVVGLFVVVFALLLPVTVTATWAHRTVLDTNTYVQTVTPVAADPAVTAAVSRQITDQLYLALDPQAVIADALPPKAAFLAGPIANAARGQVQAAVDKVLNSDQFQQLWVQANRSAHARLVTVLRGDSKVLQTTDNQVVINLVPLVNEALKNSSGFVSGVVGKPVTLPAVTSDELPSVACEKISAALGRPLPPTCGQIALFPANRLTSAQRAVQWFDRAVLALLIVTPLTFLVAMLVSRRRRRTLLQLTLGAMLGLVIMRRALMWEQNQLIDTGRSANRAARTAIVDGVLTGFFDVSLWFLLAGLVIVVIALLTGPYRWAVALRGQTASVTRKTGALVTAAVSGTVTGARDAETVAWVRQRFEALRIGGIAVAVLLLLLLNVSFWGVLVIAALLAVYELWLYRLRAPETVTLPPSP
ncbi:MAG TPA: hypothetical protein VLR26_01905 [Frankiaceae bacterium]|nr:hypothetical protein [Frankiaceae bacterium]